MTTLLNELCKNFLGIFKDYNNCPPLFSVGRRNPQWIDSRSWNLRSWPAFPHRTTRVFVLDACDHDLRLEHAELQPLRCVMCTAEPAETVTALGRAMLAHISLLFSAVAVLEDDGFH